MNTYLRDVKSEENNSEEEINEEISAISTTDKVDQSDSLSEETFC